GPTEPGISPISVQVSHHRCATGPIRFTGRCLGNGTTGWPLRLRQAPSPNYSIVYSEESTLEKSASGCALQAQVLPGVTRYSGNLQQSAHLTLSLPIRVRRPQVEVDGRRDEERQQHRD